MWFFMNQPCWNKKNSQKDDKIGRTLQQIEFEKVKNDPAGVDEIDNDYPPTDDEEEILT